jgi:hypothetical protein
MQRFREPEASPTAPRRYDDATVRNILARAAELEARTPPLTDPTTLTTEQIETLGREVGLSSEAVRLALREKGEEVVVAMSTTEVAAAVTMKPITRADVRKAGQLALVYNGVALLLILTSWLSSHYFAKPSSAPPAALILPFVIIGGIYLVLGPPIFPFVYGWRRKDWRQGLILSAALLPMYGVAVGIAVLIAALAIPNFQAAVFLNGPPYLLLAVLSLITSPVGGAVGRWWHDRTLAEER